MFFLIILTCLFTVWLQNVGAECPEIIKRKEWDGEKPKHVNFLNPPLDIVVIQHTVTQTCNNDKSCLDIVQNIQKIHVHQAYLWDIGPSFLIANTGKIYEGRGWDHVAIHTVGYNNQSFGIAFIGNFNNQEPSRKALDSARALMQCGVEIDRLTANHQVVVQSQLIPTESPGKKLSSKIMTWPNWKQDVTEIKKRADVNSEEIQSRNAEIVTSGRNILNSPKEIDLLSNSRDIIAELIDNIYKLATQTLSTIETLRRGLRRQVSLFFEGLTSRLRAHKDRINLAVSGISLIPSVTNCITPIKDRANTLYDNTETKVKTCANKRVSEIDNMINNLGTLSTNAINYANTAVEETKNCTELNLGIESSTKSCLNSVTTQTQSATRTYETQRTLVLNSIKTSLDTLPAALDLCAKKPLLEAGSQTNNFLSQFTNCKPISGFFNPF